MWHLYNLIQHGDSLRAPAVRYVCLTPVYLLLYDLDFPSRVQTVSSTGSTESHRVRLNLTIQVSRVDFSSATAQSASDPSSSTATDPSSIAPTATAALHVSGRVTSENPHVKLGAFHTLDIEANRDVRIEKEAGWDSVALERVNEAIVPGRGAEVGAVVMGEGTAAFCLLSQHMTTVTHRISVPIPRKSSGSGATQHEKGLAKFYATLYDAFVRHIPFGSVGLRAIVLASPGWVRDAAFEWMVGEAGHKGDKVLSKALREKVVRVHISSPHVHSLMEVLKSPEVGLHNSITPYSKLCTDCGISDLITVERDQICERRSHA
jgi:protein pelota